MNAAVLVVAAALSLGRYDGWSDSPAAYFLTETEREQWKDVKSEREAEAFVAQYVAARGGESFATMLDERIAAADKYLTLGDTPGSKSLRGKVVILFGPPDALDIGFATAKSEGRTGTARTSMDAGGESNGMSSVDMGRVTARDDMSGADANLRYYTFTYGDQTVVVEVHVRSGKDRIAGRKELAACNERFEAAAKASLK